MNLVNLLDPITVWAGIIERRYSDRGYFRLLYGQKCSERQEFIIDNLRTGIDDIKPEEAMIIIGSGRRNRRRISRIKYTLFPIYPVPRPDGIFPCFKKSIQKG